VAGCAAVGVHDDLAAGEAAVGVGAAQLEAAGGVDQHAVVVVLEGGGHQRADDVLDQVGLDERVGVEARLVLGRDEHGLERDRHAVLVVEGDLGLPVRAEVGQDARLAHLGEAVGETVGQPDRHGHEVFGLVDGVAEHHSLVAGALAVEVFLGALGPLLVRGVDALGDVGRLGVDRRHDAAGVAVEADGLAVVADALDRLAHDRGDLDVGAGGDLAGDDGQTGGHHGLAGHPGLGILRQDRVEDGVTDLVGHLVGMALGD
jgi:hypothetical protein